MSRYINYTYGEQVGDAIYLNDFDHHIKRRCALFRCKCGNSFVARIAHVKNFGTRGCGCMVGKDLGSRGNRSTHNQSNHPLYNVWNAMKSRCYNKNRSQYKDYGGRGVVVCDEWKNDFYSFYEWAIKNGWKNGLQLDKDSKGDGMIYSPQTCCFLTPKQNSNKRGNNKSIEYKGQLKTASEWADIFNIPLTTIHTRLGRGWDADRCFNQN